MGKDGPDPKYFPHRRPGATFTSLPNRMTDRMGSITTLSFKVVANENQLAMIQPRQRPGTTRNCCDFLYSIIVEQNAGTKALLHLLLGRN